MKTSTLFAHPTENERAVDTRIGSGIIPFSNWPCEQRREPSAGLFTPALQCRHQNDDTKTAFSASGRECLREFRLLIRQVARSYLMANVCSLIPELFIHSTDKSYNVDGGAPARAFPRPSSFALAAIGAICERL